MSARPSIRSPSACSGARYSGVPTTIPPADSEIVPPPAGCARWATPKSSTSAQPSSATSTFSGLLSPCTTPAARATPAASRTRAPPRGEAAAPGSDRRQRPPGNGLAHEIETVPGAPDLDHARPPGMVEASRRLGLALNEPSPQAVLRQGHHLHHVGAPVALGAIDCSQRAFAQRFDERVRSDGAILRSKYSYFFPDRCSGGFLTPRLRSAAAGVSSSGLTVATTARSQSRYFCATRCTAAAPTAWIDAA